MGSRDQTAWNNTNSLGVNCTNRHACNSIPTAASPLSLSLEQLRSTQLQSLEQLLAHGADHARQQPALVCHHLLCGVQRLLQACLLCSRLQPRPGISCCA